MAVEIAGARGLSLTFQIACGCNSDDSGLADLARDKARVRKGAITNGEVDAFFDEIACPLGDERLDNDLGIANAERRELRYDIEAREGRRGADAHHAGRRGLAVTDTGLRCFEIGDQPHRRLEEIAPGLGQAQTAGGAHEQLRAKMLLKRGDLLTNRRLPCPKLASDCRKAPAFDDAHEYL